MELKDYRKKIDAVDEDILRLFMQRMELSEKIASWKQENNMAVLDLRREQEKLRAMEELAPEELKDGTFSLFSMLMELSRVRQNQILHPHSPTRDSIERALQETDPLFPEKATVACQGVEGAYSGIACAKLFRRPNIFYFSSFEAVFSAVEKGLCRYGVIPVENSTAGSVNAVYDLMSRHDFRIVRSIRVKVDHNLMVKPGLKRKNIKEIWSHSQAISQCSCFLSGFPNVKIVPCENTAIAAKAVAESAPDAGIAAISSAQCAELYGLEMLEREIQDSGNNYTRFICISRELEIYPGADRTSLMMVVKDEPGSLYKVLSRFYALGINMHKLESRTIPGRNFEFLFYFDLDTSVYSPRFIQLMGELGDLCESYSYLGSYSEVI